MKATITHQNLTATIASPEYAVCGSHVDKETFYLAWEIITALKARGEVVSESKLWDLVELKLSENNS